MNWKLFKQIINDKNRKFLSEFWSTLFGNFEIKLFYSIAYHSQTNELFERTNQTAKITLRYHMITLNDFRVWIKVFFAIQRVFNNFVFFIDHISNEVVYEFIFTELTNLVQSFHFTTATWICQKIANVIVFFQLIFKFHYDKKHKPIHLVVENWALLRFHHEYSILSTEKLKKKLFQQFVDPFKVLKRIGNLTYRLKMPLHWRIHSVFIIAQLKSAFDFNINLYDRQNIKLLSMYVEKNTDQIKSFIVKKIVQSRTTSKEKKYLIKWKGYDSKKDAWRTLTKMKNVLYLVRKYENKQSKQVSFNKRFFKIFFQHDRPSSSLSRKRGRSKKISSTDWKKTWKTTKTPFDFLLRQNVTETKSFFFLRIIWFR